MSDVSQNLLTYYGYEKMLPERKKCFEASLKELGVCIRATRMECVGTVQCEKGYAITDSELYGE